MSAATDTIDVSAPESAAAEAPDFRNVQAHDFRAGTAVPAAELRALRAHQAEFATAFSSRLSLFLRLDAATRLASIQTVTFQRLAESWDRPTHLTIFKIEPLRGVGTLEIPPALGSAFLDRLMGGTGTASDSGREFSEIENALLEQAAGLFLNEWCGRWRGVKELKPTVLGQENDGQQVQIASPGTVMVVIAVEARVGACCGTIQFALPYASIESLVRQVSPGPGTRDGSTATSPAAPLKWNSCFDDVCVPINAQWEGLEMTARDLLSLKVGDVLRMDSAKAGQVRVSVADHPRFNGRPGTLGGKWAVELTHTIHP